MTKKIVPPIQNAPYNGLPRTRLELQLAKDKGLISGWFTKLPVGRPKGSKKKRKDPPLSVVPPVPPVVVAKKPRPVHQDWTQPGFAEVLQYYVDKECTRFSSGEQPTLPAHLDDMAPPSRGVIADWVKATQLHAKNNGGRKLTVLQLRRERSKLLLPIDFRKRLQFVIVARDAQNRGMSRKEALDLIRKVTGCSNAQDDNHFDYLVRNKLLPDLKGNGATIKAQATTTNRSQITMEQQLRWHTVVEKAIDVLEVRNQPSEEFIPVRSHFWANVDETCVLGSEGVIRVIASKHRKKTEKNMNDFRDSITIVRSGCASGESGPWIFLAKGKEMTVNSFRNLCRDHKAPPGSKVIMTPNAYMTDDTWLIVVPQLIEGLRSLPVVRDHPDWWMAITLDGFGSHLQQKGIDMFTEAKILILQEEGDSSHVNQPYDQFVAKADKNCIRQDLDLCRMKIVKGPLNQWSLIGISLVGLKRVPEDSWTRSFQATNLHPDHRVCFSEWARKIDTDLATGDQFFRGRSTLYDAMPALWKTMSVEERQLIVARIDKYHNDSLYNDVDPWSKMNVLELMEFVPLADMDTLRGCYLVAKREPDVITRTITEANDASDHISLHPVFNNARMYPTDLVVAFTAGKADFIPTRVNEGPHEVWTRWRPVEDNWRPLLQHLHYRAGRAHTVAAVKSNQKALDFVPSKYLMCEVSDYQKTQFNDSIAEQRSLFFAEEDAYGDGAKQKRARRRLDIMDGNIKSHARWLNDPERMECNLQLLRLQAVMANIRVDADDKKALAAEEKKKKEEEKLKKKEAAIAADNLKAETLNPVVTEHVDRGFGHIKTLKVAALKEILIYYYLEPKGVVKKLKKQQLLDLIEGNMVEPRASKDKPDDRDNEAEEDSDDGLEEGSDEDEEPQEVFQKTYDEEDDDSDED
jgi:hypothetical protein